VQRWGACDRLQCRSVINHTVTNPVIGYQKRRTGHHPIRLALIFLPLQPIIIPSLGPFPEAQYLPFADTHRATLPIAESSQADNRLLLPGFEIGFHPDDLCFFF